MQLFYGILFIDFIFSDGKSSGVITISRFDKASKWIGPFFDPESGVNIIQSLNSLYEKLYVLCFMVYVLWYWVDYAFYA